MQNQPILAGPEFKHPAGSTVSGLFSPFHLSSRSLLPVLAVLLGLAAMRPASAAETAAETRTPIYLPGSEEVVVTASRTEEEVAFVPSNVTVLNEQDISNSTAASIPELLSTASGVTITDLTGSRRNYRVDLRGFGETSGANTLVLVNGRRINQPDLSGVDWTQIPLSQVRRIEIVRGGRGGVLFGDSASAGVINIITGAAEGDRGSVTLRGGSYGSVGLDAGYAGKTDQVAYSFSGDLYGSSGYRDNSDTQGRDAGLALRFTPGSRFRIDFSSGYHHDETGMPGALTEADLENGTPREGTLYPDDKVNVNEYYFQAKPALLFLGDSSFETDFSFRRRDNVFFSSSYWGYYQGDTRLDTVSLSPRLVLAGTGGEMRNRLSIGLDLIRSDEDILNSTSYSPQASFSLEKKNLGAYLHDELFLTESLAVSGGYRYDRVKYGFGPAAGEPEFRESLATAGINWQFQDRNNLYFEYGSGLRYPLLDEMFDFYSNSINSALVPQESDTFQAGLRCFVSDFFYLNPAVFLLRTEHELFYNPAGGPWGYGANENFAGNNRRAGLEIESGIQAGRLALSGSYTYTDSEVLDGIYAGSAIPGVPTHTFSTRGTFLCGDAATLTLEGVYTGARHFESDWGNAFPRQNDYFLLNSRLQYRVGKSLLHLDLKNLLNQEYSQYGVLGGNPNQRAYYPSPKFNVMAGITFGF